MPPRSDGKVSQSNYIVKSLRVFIRSSRRNVVDQCILHMLADEINISFAAARRFGRLAEAYTNFRQVRCPPLDYFRSWHHPGGERATGWYDFSKKILLF